jgi:hypothetical protein
MEVMVAMVHDEVDVDRWTSLFSLDRLRAEAQSRTDGPPRDTIVISPADFAVILQLRAEMAAAIPLGTAVPTDIFVWAKGEPPRREVTKVGGLPYWPAARAWPERTEGGPLMFVGQFCFADSRDIAGELPGDVLAIFAHPTWTGMFDEHGYAERGMVFEWLTLGLGEADLITPDDVPKVDSTWPISPYYGAIHRTFDHPDLGSDGGDFGWDHPEWSGLGLLKATKIGGVPWWEQYDPGVPGRFLCALESIQPALDGPYPYLNVPEPIGPSVREQYPEDDLMWGDLGRLYLQLHGERVFWEIQFG